MFLGCNLLFGHGFLACITSEFTAIQHSKMLSSEPILTYPMLFHGHILSLAGFVWVLFKLRLSLEYSILLTCAASLSGSDLRHSSQLSVKLRRFEFSSKTPDLGASRRVKVLGSSPITLFRLLGGGGGREVDARANFD